MKRAIGIDINKKHVSLVQLCNKGGKFLLEKTYTSEITNTHPQKEAPVEEIQAAIKGAIHSEGFDTKASAIISMPYGKVFFHNYKTEIASDRDIEQLIKFELEDDFPISFDDLLIDICSKRNLNEHESNFFVGAVSRSKLQDWIKTISETGLNCSIVTSDACTFGSFVNLHKNSNSEDPSIITYIDDCRMIITVYQHGALLFARHLDNIQMQDTPSVMKREIELTLNNAGISNTSKILLICPPEYAIALSGQFSKEGNRRIVTLNPFDGIESTTKPESDDKLTIALGLALTGLDNGNKALNFLAADKAGIEQAVKTKRNAVVFAILLLALTAMFLLNLFARLSALENEKQSLEQQIRGIFVQTFPDEKKIVNELAQMNEKYNSLEHEYNTIASEIFDRTPALEILENISAKITPDQNISVFDITMTADSVQLSATAADFESIDNLVEKFKKISEFSSIDTGNINVDSANNRVRFNLSMKVGVN